MDKLKVNRRLLPIKLHYFLYNAGTAPVVPFLSTYARQLGFSSVTVGLVYTIVPIFGMVAKPTTGAIADRFRCRKLIFLLAIALTSLAVLALYYTPRLRDVERSAEFNCDGASIGVQVCSQNFTCVDQQISALSGNNSQCELTCEFSATDWTVICGEWGFCNNATTVFNVIINHDDIAQQQCLHFGVDDVIFDGISHDLTCTTNAIRSTCQISCDSYILNEMMEEAAVEDENTYALYQFWVFLLFMIFCWVGQAVAGVMGDAICFELLDDKPHKYGKQRLFGALSYGIFSAVAGYLIDFTSSGMASKNYIYAFYLGFAMLIVDVVTGWLINYDQKDHCQNIFSNVFQLLINPSILIYLAWCIIVGMCTGLIWQFLYWLLEDLAAARGCDSYAWIKTLQGLIQAVQCLLGELPFYYLSGWIFRVIGHVWSMTLVLLAIGVRLTLYSVITNPWWFLPVELLNGVTSGLFYACMASYAKIVAPSGAEATVQGLVGASYEGIGVSLGSFLAGLFYSQYGGALTFRIFGVAALVACGLHCIVNVVFLHKRERARQEKEKK